MAVKSANFDVQDIAQAFSVYFLVYLKSCEQTSQFLQINMVCSQ